MTFVTFSDYYLSIPLWVHSFLISFHWDSYALIIFLFPRVSITWLRQRESEKTALCPQGGGGGG
jgi:hypothetical protein